MFRNGIAATFFFVYAAFTAAFPAQSLSDSNIDTNNPEAYFQQGKSLLIAGDEVNASGLFKKAISLDQSYDTRIIDEYFKAGLSLIKDNKKSNIGLHYLNKYLTKYPDKKTEMASILYDEGKAIITRNKYMAHVILARAMELDPSFEKDERFYFTYAVKTPVKPAEVIRNGDEYLSRFPDGEHVAEALYIIGNSYVDMRRSHEGRKYFIRLEKEYPDTEWARKAAGHYR